MSSRVLLQHNYREIYRNSFKQFTRFASLCPPCGKNETDMSSYTATTEISCLESGMRVASQFTNSPTSTVSILMDCSAIPDKPMRNGVGTFIEHLLFKGTAKFPLEKLENELLPLGAVLDCSTERGTTAIYAKCLSNDVSKMVEIIADIVENIKVGDTDIEAVRPKILEEVENIWDTDIEQLVFDQLHAMAYQGTPLGNSLLGTIKDFENIQSSDISTYVENNFVPTRMVLACAGGCEHTELISIACKYFSGKNKSGCSNSEEILPTVDCRYTGSEVRIRDDDIPYAHVAIAIESPGYGDPQNLGLNLANCVIGSWDRSQPGGAYNASNLIRYSEQENLCHSFRTFNLSYKETGLFGIYFVCDPMQCELMMYNIQNEWLRLCTMPTESELHRAKETYKAKMYLNLGCKTQTCKEIAMNVLQGNKYHLATLEQEIDGYTKKELQACCYENIYDKCPVICAVGPIENLPDYNRIRSSMYWLRV